MTEVFRIRRRQRAPIAVEQAAPVVEGKRERKGWANLKSEVRGEMRALGRVDAVSLDDLRRDW
jgi:ribosomal protein S11